MTDNNSCLQGFTDYETFQQHAIQVGTLTTTNDAGTRLFPSIKFSHDYEIKKWIIGGAVNTSGTNYPEVQVWRSNIDSINESSTVYTKISSYPITNLSTNSNLHEYYPPFLQIVRKGDVLGLFHPQNQTMLNIYYQTNTGSFNYMVTDSAPQKEILVGNVSMVNDYPLITAVVIKLTTPVVISTTTAEITSTKITSTEIITTTSTEMATTEVVSTTTTVEIISTPTNINLAGAALTTTSSQVIEQSSFNSASPVNTATAVDMKYYESEVAKILVIVIAIGGFSLILNSICITGICLIIFHKFKKTKSEAPENTENNATPNVNDNADTEQPPPPTTVTTSRQSMQENPLYNRAQIYKNIYYGSNNETATESTSDIVTPYAISTIQPARPYEEWTLQNCKDGFIIK